MAFHRKKPVPYRKNRRTSNKKKQRYNERLRQSWNNSRHIVFVSLGTLFFMSAIVLVPHLLMTSQGFRITSIDVQGIKYLSKQTVLNASGIQPEQNVFDVQLDTIKNNLQELPWVETLWLYRKLPNTIVINITEHKPSVAIHLGKFYLANEQGIVFKQYHGERATDPMFPIITGLDRKDYQTRPNATKHTIRKSMQFWKDYMTNSQRPQLSELHLGSQQTITLQSYDSPLVMHFGKLDDPNYIKKFRSFDAVWQSLTIQEKKHAQILYANDTIHPNRLVMRFSKSI